MTFDIIEADGNMRNIEAGSSDPVLFVPSKISDGDVEDEELDPIAIIGFSLQFPQEATSPEAFWNMMASKRCATTEFPAKRRNANAYHHPVVDKHNLLPLRGGHFIEEDPGLFDADFFSIAPTEAIAMDPAQRILLETAYRAFENAGIPLEELRGSNTSVHTGCFTDDYKLQLIKDPEQMPRYTATGVALSMLANRLSWFYNLTGPSVNLDSACSSSAMALDQACQLLRSKDCSMGLVAGCNLIYGSDYETMLTDMSFLSPDNRCFTFDQRANGYARGEGIGVVVLKRLSDAIHHGDTIRAVIRSTGANQDGHTPGITQPCSKAQEELITQTYRKAGLSMKHTRFFEAHGTGTAVGDPTEIMALGNAFREHRIPDEPLYVGAVKTNIGHLEGASGIAGLIKTILVLEKGVIPPNANFEQINPRIDTKFSRVSFPLTCIPWPESGLRRASVNSFGFGGSNSHVVLDDAFNYLTSRNLPGKHKTVSEPPPNPENKTSLQSFAHYHIGDSQESEDHESTHRFPRILLWSASDALSLDRLAASYQNYFSTIPKDLVESRRFISDLAYTLDSRRSSLPWRSYAVVDTVADIGDLKTRMSTPLPVESIPPRLGFLFTGQGAQWYAMGRELFRYPIFKKSIANAGLYLTSLGCQWSVIDELMRGESESNIHDPEFSQSLCTILQVALVDLLENLGVVPCSVVGHSSGEIAAAYSIGALSQESAWKIAYYRGLFAGSLSRDSLVPGAMVAVALSVEEIQTYLAKARASSSGNGLTVSCINSPKSVTISGEEDLVNALQRLLDRNRIFSRKLSVTVAYHSRQMDKVSDKYLASLGTLSGRIVDTAVNMISSVTGKMITKQQLCQATYWVKNMVSPVLFMEALQTLCSKSRASLTKKLDLSHRNVAVVELLIEIGPHAALQHSVRETLKDDPRSQDIRYKSALIRGAPASESIMELLGQLHTLGVPVNLRRVNDPEVAASNFRIALANLPEYPFNHSQSYWHESRISKSYRLGNRSHNELLGSPVQDWNPLDARWRNFLQPGDMPWVQDHKVNGITMYPAAGMLVMAIEAAHQIADPHDRIIGYNLRDVAFEQPLEISSNLGALETQISLRPSKQAETRGSMWYDFIVFSFAAESWAENCRGAIQIQYKKTDALEDVSESLEDRERVDAYLRVWQSSLETCKRSTDPQHMYQFLRQSGVDYGPSFQSIKNLYCSTRSEAKADIDLSRHAYHSSGSQPHIIHPATLDAVTHLMFAALSKGGTEDMFVNIPTAIKTLWVSNEGFRATDSCISVLAEITSETIRNVTASTFAFSEDLLNLRIIMEGLETSFIAAPSDSVEAPREPSQVCCNIDAKLDIEMLSPIKTLEWLNEISKVNTREPAQFFQDLTLLLQLYLRELKHEIDSTSVVLCEPHFVRYLKWVDYQLKKSNSTELRDVPRSTREAIYARVKDQGAVGKLFVEVGDKLLSVLKGDVDVIQLLFESDLVENYYKEFFGPSNCVPKLEKYLDALGQKYPRMKILEVGAGTGAATAQVLNALSRQGERGSDMGALRCEKYDFTDISPSFFEKARVTFSHYHPKIDFRVFNIETDPNVQGYQKDSYDLVIAAGVLHATKSLATTVQNMRKVLKLGGKLLIHEPTMPTDIKTGFVFGLLPGWWLGSEANRTLSPALTIEAWNDLLQKNGFTGTDLVLKDFEDESCHQISIIISTAKELSEDLPIMPGTLIVIDEDSALQSELAERLKARIERDGQPVAQIVPLQRAVLLAKLSTYLCVVCLELEQPFLSNLGKSAYLALRSLLTTTNRVLWINGGGGVSVRDPGFGMIDGFARTLRTEVSRLRMVTLALEEIKEIEDRTIETVVRVMNRSFTKVSKESYEREYVEIMGMLHVKRITEAKNLDRCMIRQPEPKQLEFRLLGDCGSLRLGISTPGHLDSLEYVADAGSSDNLQSGQVEVEVKAIALHSNDYIAATDKGRSLGLGRECAGIVRRAEEGSDLRPGDRVCMYGTSVFRTYARSTRNLVAAIPDNVSLEQASALPHGGLVASYVIDEIIRLTKDDSILIHAGAGPVCQAAIKLSQQIGATVYTTASTEAERRLLTDAHQMADDRILSDVPLLHQLNRATGGRGVNAVLGSLEGDGFADSWGCMAPFGRFVQIKRADGRLPKEITMSDVPSNLTFSIVDPESVLQAWATQRCKPLQEIIDTTAKALKVRLHTFEASQVTEAFGKVNDVEGAEKVVVRMDHDDKIALITDVEPSYSFDSDASYLISGGLGGLGRSIAQWMIHRGARNLILLSRSGPRTHAVRQMLVDMANQGVQVETPRCDVTDISGVKAVLFQCSKKVPPIKGCIQASMVLNDIVYEKMSFEEWDTTLNSKARASWNLHAALPDGLDFFVMISSISGIIGQVSQVNYAAGNTYQDSLARYRVAKGEKAASLDIGIVESEGYLVENSALLDRLTNTGYFQPISKPTLLALFDYFCNPSLQISASAHCQPIIGIKTPAGIRAQGIPLPDTMCQPLWQHMYQVGESEGGHSESRAEQTMDLSALLASAQTSAEIGVIITDALIKRVSHTLSVSEDKFDVDKPLYTYGVDSLVAVDLRNWIANTFDMDVTVSDILGGLGNTSLAAFGLMMAKRHEQQHPPREEEQSGIAQ